MSFKRFGDLLVYLLLRVVVSIVQALSMESCHAVARVLAYLIANVLRFRADITDENLRIALPDASPADRCKLARRMWEHLLLMGVEIFHAPRKIHETNWRNFVRVVNLRAMVTALLLERPKVVVTAHFGNFEVAGYMTGLLGLKTHTVARTINNRYIDDYINAFRELKGQFILPKVGSAPEAKAVLETNGILVLLGDQHAGGRGCWVNFMGRPSSCHKALALFTLMSGAPMIAVYCKREKRPLHFELGLAGIVDPQVPCPELAGVRQLTQWYNNVLEREIRKAPHQYWWVHRRWRNDQPKRQSGLAAADGSQKDEAQPPDRAAA